MLIVISGFPASFIGMFFTGSLMIEIIFSLDGLGLLGYNAINQLDYPVVFGSLYLFSLMGLLINIVCDWLLGWVDPRIDLTKGTRA
jgi:microcin C transport system permease protein